MAQLLCPICASSVADESAEAHIRLDLSLPSSRCRLCPAAFSSRPEAQRHTRQHPGSDACVEDQRLEQEDQLRLDAALRLARGGVVEWARRMCFCGSCRLLCREQEENSDQSSPQDTLVEASKSSEELGVKAEASHATPSLLSSAPPPPQQPKKRQKQRQKLSNSTLASIGTLPCQECNGKPVDKLVLQLHVLNTHLKERPLQCLFCTDKAMSKEELSEHQRAAHGVVLTAETISVGRADGGEVERWLWACSGVSGGSGYGRLRCNGCGERVRRYELRNHVAAVHLKEPLHSCRRCPYSNYSCSVSRLKRHVRDVHKLAPSDETMDNSGFRSYQSTILVMVQQLFGQPTEPLEKEGATPGQSESTEASDPSELPEEVALGSGREVASMAKGSDEWSGRNLAGKEPQAGLVTCRQCRREVNRYSLNNHVKAQHMSSSNYQCKFCPFAAKVMRRVNEHLILRHNTKCSEESYVRLYQPEHLKQLKFECFGETQKLTYKQKQCKSCSKHVRVLDLKRHVASEHLKKVLYACRACGFGVKSSDRGQMNQHVRIKHKGKGGDDTVDDSGVKHNAPALQAMISKLFDL